MVGITKFAKIFGSANEALETRACSAEDHEPNKKEVFLKRKFLTLTLLLAFAVGSFCANRLLAATLDWEITKQIKLERAPLDVATSTDGRWIFVLTQGEILFYSMDEGRVVNRISVDNMFDTLTHSGKDNTLVIGSHSGKTLKIIQLEVIHTIDISELPFKGPEHAPVTIAVFGDYQ